MLLLSNLIKFKHKLISPFLEYFMFMLQLIILSLQLSKPFNQSNSIPSFYQASICSGI